MSRLYALVLAALAALFASTSAHGIVTLTATMTNAAENPPVGTAAPPLLTSTGAPRPASFGSATFVLNDAMTAMTMTATINNIDINGMQTPNDTNDTTISARRLS